MDKWSHTQKIDCDHLPFNYKSCHVYGHFARNCSKMQENGDENKKKKECHQVAKNGKQIQNNKNQNSKQT